MASPGPLIQKQSQKNWLISVSFSVCRHSLNGLQIPAESLPAFIKVVSVGVLELIEKQNKGFAYIKP
jgi:uncharacterized protein